MNDDFENMSSMCGAYVDDDGIEIGANDVTRGARSRVVRRRARNQTVQLYVS